jgi:hypothetical protein
MKKTLFLLILLLTTNLIKAQSLSDLLYFRSMSLNQVEEKLILEDWKFRSSKNDTKRDLPKNKSSFLDTYNAAISDSYKSRTYEYIGYAGDITTIKVTEFEDDRKNEIKIESENKLVYQNILTDLIASNFSLSNENCPYESYYLGDYNIGEKVIMESNGKVYKNGNNKIHLIINRYGVVESKNSYDNTFSYYPEKMTDKFLIYVE